MSFPLDDPTAWIETVPAARPRPHGNLDRVDPDGVIEGWCWDSEAPNRRLIVEICIDGKIVSHARCDGMRPELACDHIGDGAYGFLLVLSPDLCPPGVRVMVSLRDAETRKQIGASHSIRWDPSVVLPSLGESNFALEGNLDGVTNQGSVSGWCWRPMQPRHRVHVVVTINDAVIGTVIAIKARDDLQLAGIGDGRYGFNFHLPHWVIQHSGDLTISVSEMGTGLAFGLTLRMRLSLFGQTLDRLKSLESELRRRRHEVALLQTEISQRAIDTPARQIFSALGDLFSELASVSDSIEGGEITLPGPSPIGLPNVIPKTNRERLTLSVPRNPVATLVIPAIVDVEAMHDCLKFLHNAGDDQIVDIVILDVFSNIKDFRKLAIVVDNIRIHKLVNHENIITIIGRVIRPNLPVVYLSPQLRPEYGWLPRLLASFGTEPSAGLVGVRIVGNDSLLRHGGILADASDNPAVFGSLQPAGRSEYRVLRQVEAVGAFSFAISASAIETIKCTNSLLNIEPRTTLGNMSLDLCLRIRRGGMKIFMQSTVTAICPETLNITDYVADLSSDVNAVEWLQSQWRSRTPLHKSIGTALVIGSGTPSFAVALDHYSHLKFLRGLGYRIVIFHNSEIQMNDSSVRDLEEVGIEIVVLPQYASISSFLFECGSQLHLVHIADAQNSSRLADRVRLLAPHAMLIVGDRVPEAVPWQSENPVFLRQILDQRRSTATYKQRSGIALIVDSSKASQVDGLSWFLEMVLPMIRNARSDIPIHLVFDGSFTNLSTTITMTIDPYIVWHQTVDAIFHLSVRATLMPMRFGAPDTVQIATWLSLGVPMVANRSVHADWMGDDLLSLADTAPEIAASLVMLHDSEELWVARSAYGALQRRERFARDAAFALYCQHLCNQDRS